MKRKGARSLREIPADVLRQLNEGTLETANLVECLAIDQTVLLKNILQQGEYTHLFEGVRTALAQLKKPSFNTRNACIGEALFHLSRAHPNHTGALQQFLQTHPADLVRCWAAYFLVSDTQQTFAEQLTALHPLADDPHFGVREISWMALRPRLAVQLSEGIALLTAWAGAPQANIRRFACELTRPCGVWCAHLPVLKEQPEQALSVLEPLKADPSRYVQDSVGNWLNDASKSRPDFVDELCQRWQMESTAPETAYIVHRALRTLHKKKPKNP